MGSEMCIRDRDYRGPTRHELDHTRSGTCLTLNDLDHEVGIDYTDHTDHLSNVSYDYETP